MLVLCSKGYQRARNSLSITAISKSVIWNLYTISVLYCTYICNIERIGQMIYNKSFWNGMDWIVDCRSINAKCVRYHYNEVIVKKVTTPKMLLKKMKLFNSSLLLHHKKNKLNFDDSIIFMYFHVFFCSLKLL